MPTSSAPTFNWSIFLGFVDFAVAAGIDDVEALPQGLDGGLRVLDLAFRQSPPSGSPQRDIRGPGHDRSQQLQPLR